MEQKTYPYKSGKIDIFGDEIWIFEPGGEDIEPYSITFDNKEDREKWDKENFPNITKFKEAGNIINKKQPTMPKNIHSDQHKARLGSKYIGEGVSVTDKQTDKRYKIKSMNEGGVTLQENGAFSNATKNEINVPYSELEENFNNGSIDIGGYEHTEPDGLILHQVISEIIAYYQINDMSNSLSEFEAEEENFNKGGFSGKMKYSKNGNVKSIQHKHGKVINRVNVGGQIYNYDNKTQTYRSEGGNVLKKDHGGDIEFVREARAKNPQDISDREIHTMDDGGETGYQGWTNFETWNVKLWIDNERGDYEYWSDRAKEVYKESKKDQYSSKKANATYALSAELKDQFEENNPLADEANTYADLLNGALREVNWYEIAESIMADNVKSEGGNLSDRREQLEGMLSEKDVKLKDFDERGFASNATYKGFEIEEYNYDENGTIKPLPADVKELIDQYVSLSSYEESDDLETGGKVDVTPNYYRFRQKSPAGVTECAVPDWAERVAESVKEGAKVTTCKKDGEWFVQSIMIPKNGIDAKKARSLANEIKAKFSKKKNALGGMADCGCHDIDKTKKGLETMRDISTTEEDKQKYQELINNLN